MPSYLRLDAAGKACTNSSQPCVRSLASSGMQSSSTSCATPPYSSPRCPWSAPMKVPRQPAFEEIIDRLQQSLAEERENRNRDDDDEKENHGAE
eukprot:853588-Rhodomonas_salina.6